MRENCRPFSANLVVSLLMYIVSLSVFDAVHPKLLLWGSCVILALLLEVCA